METTNRWLNNRLKNNKNRERERASESGREMMKKKEQRTNYQTKTHIISNIFLTVYILKLASYSEIICSLVGLSDRRCKCAS